MEIKDSYSEDNYTLWEKKSNVEYPTKSSPTYIDNIEMDVAKQKIGNNWHIPTEDEFKELKDKCKWEWNNNNGVWGYYITGPNGNIIFLPAAGYKTNNNIYSKGEKGYYWLCDSSIGFCFDNSNIHIGAGSAGNKYYGYTWNGHLIRPVYELTLRKTQSKYENY